MFEFSSLVSPTTSESSVIIPHLMDEELSTQKSSPIRRGQAKIQASSIFCVLSFFSSVLLTFQQPWSSLPWTYLPLLALSDTVLFSSTVWWRQDLSFTWGSSCPYSETCGANMYAGVGWLQSTICFPSALCAEHLFNWMGSWKGQTHFLFPIREKMFFPVLAWIAESKDLERTKCGPHTWHQKILFVETMKTRRHGGAGLLLLIWVSHSSSSCEPMHLPFCLCSCELSWDLSLPTRGCWQILLHLFTLPQNTPHILC